MIDIPNLIRQAFAAREMAYAPYSSFLVGAALETADGKIYRGCNIESAAYSPTNCAERTAFFGAVAQGERDFAAIAIVGAKGGTQADDFAFVFPCGVCRQVMKEFCRDDFLIIAAKSQEEYKVCTLAQLFPEGFGPEDLTEK